MLDRLRAIPKRVLEIWNNWTKTQRTIIVSSVAVVLIAVIILVVVLTRPNYQTLTTCEDYTEMSEVTALLDSNGYDYHISDNTLTVQVRRADLTAAKMLIASADIRSDGYTVEDALSSSFTTTESDRTKRWEYYLEQQFQSDLESMDGIRSASVNVQTADDANSFYASTAEASVAVVLNTSGTISDDYAQSIANFLATSVGNQTTNNITIIGSDGTTIFNGADASTISGVSYSNQQKYKGQIENLAKNSMKQQILSTGLYDDAYFTMNLVLNWDTVNRIATEYEAQNGNDQGLFEHSYESESEGLNGASGTPGTTSNDDDTTYTITDGSSSSTASVREYDYLPNQYVTTTTSQPGSPVYEESSLAVTLVQNVVYREDECEDLGLLDDITWEEFQQQNAASVALEVDPQWAEIFSVGSGVPAENIVVNAYQRSWFEDSTDPGIFSTVTFWLQIALAAAILALLVFVVVRSARPLTVEEKEPELSVEEMLATTKENQPSVDDIDLSEKSETRKAIEKFVDENPEAVALLLRNWLNDGWD